MPNLFNYLAGILGFIVGIALVFALWEPMVNILGFLPTPLFIFASVSWILIIFVGTVYLPMSLMVLDDKGQ